MAYRGNIRKMRTEFTDPVGYFLPVGGEEIPMNELVGKNINFRFNRGNQLYPLWRKDKNFIWTGILL